MDFKELAIVKGFCGNSSSEGVGIKHKRIEMSFLPSDLIIPVDSSVRLDFCDEKTEEVSSLLLELTQLRTLLINFTIKIPELGEVYRYPISFNPKNEMLGSNGYIMGIYGTAFTSDGETTYLEYLEGFSISSNNMCICPPNARAIIAYYGCAIDIDVLYL